MFCSKFNCGQTHSHPRYVLNLMPTLFIFKFILKEGSMNTDIAKKLDQVIQLLQLSLLAQRVNTLSGSTDFKFQRQW